MANAIQLTPANSIAYLIPLTALNQEFDVSLAGVTYHLRVWWSAASNCWILDVADSERNRLISGIPLVTGCDLLEQYGYVEINGAMVVQSSNDADFVPTNKTLGGTGNLYFLIPISGNA